MHPRNIAYLLIWGGIGGVDGSGAFAGGLYGAGFGIAVGPDDSAWITNFGFKTPNCSLCTKERIAILRASKENPNTLINSSTEIFGACRHKSKFHRFIRKDSPALMSQQDERVQHPTTVTTEV